jgi:hypothetical protein
MSLSGGTGCGSFINVAQIVKDAFEGQVNIYGYGVLYGVFRAMDPTGLQTPRVRLNTYSALLDLDYFSSRMLSVKPLLGVVFRGSLYLYSALAQSPHKCNFVNLFHLLILLSLFTISSMA